jgi:hypothetical protein
MLKLTEPRVPTVKDIKGTANTIIDLDAEERKLFKFLRSEYLID